MPSTCPSLLVTTDSATTRPLSSYQVSHRMCLDTEELALRSAIYASSADSMVASVIEELSPKDECSKLLREKLAIIQEAQVSAVSAGFAAASNLQLLRRDALLKNFGFQPQVFSSVRTAPFEGNHVVGLEPKVLHNRVCTIRQADRIAGSSVTFAQKHREPKTHTKVTSSKKTASRTSVFGRLGSPTSTRPQLTHQSISFRTRNSRQDLQKAVDDLLIKGAIERVSNVTRLMWCLPSCSDASGCPQVSAFRGQQGVPVHLSSVWTGDLSTRVHQAAANRVSLFRQQGVKLHVYLDDWLIRADTPEQAQLQAQTTFRVLQFLARSSTSRSPISHQVKTSSSLGCSSTLDVSQWRPTEDASKGPVSSSALDDQSEHHGQRFAQTSWHAGVHGLRWSGEDGSVFVQSNSGPPQHGARGPATGPTGFKFHSGSVRDGMVVIPSSPARSTPRHQGDGSNSLHRCVQFELGSQLGSRSTRGRWSASQRSGILRRLKNILPTPVLLTLYNTLILPHFHYGLLNWGFSMGRLQLLQKRSVRVISSSKYNAHTDPLFKKLRLIKLADLFTLNVLKMYYKFKHACLPSHVENMFEEFSRNHEHETRQSLILEEPMVNTASGENCLRYILPRIINKTNPTIIKIIDSHSFEGFVRYLKNYMIIHYVDYCVIPNCYICNHMNP